MSKTVTRPHKRSTPNLTTAEINVITDRRERRRGTGGLSATGIVLERRRSTDRHPEDPATEDWSDGDPHSEPGDQEFDTAELPGIGAGLESLQARAAQESTAGRWWTQYLTLGLTKSPLARFARALKKRLRR